MKCPHCGYQEHRVLETRVQKDGDIRRRRECLKCKGRFATLELLVQQFPHVAKKGGVREPFDAQKLRRGIQLACLKRPVALAQIDGIVNRISRCVLDQNDKEITSIDVGKMVMKELKQMDSVAYVRFASVYRTFQDVQEFVSSLEQEVPPKETEL